VLEIWEGGLNWHAGLIGGSIGAWLIAHRARDRQPIELLDVFALAAPVGLAFGWIGSQFAATAYGRELYPGDPFFRLAVDQPELYGLAEGPRWPSQLLGAAWSTIVFVGLLLTRRRAWPAGTRFWLFVTAYSLGAFLIGFTRGDDVPRLNGWRIDQLLDAALVAAGFSQVLRSLTPRPPLTKSNRFA
jgi:phosphatidylglycerol---prolipoprotein diacylglyceryl transferase